MIRGAEAFRSVEGNIEDIDLVRCQRAPRCQGAHARLYAFCRDPGRSSNCPGSRPGPHRERRKPKPMMHGMKKSDEAVRPVKAVNKGAHACAEPLEERASTKGNPERQSTRRTQCRESVPQAAARIREAVNHESARGAQSGDTAQVMLRSPSPYISHVTPSTPAAAPRFKA